MFSSVVTGARPEAGADDSGIPATMARAGCFGFSRTAAAGCRACDAIDDASDLTSKLSGASAAGFVSTFIGGDNLDAGSLTAPPFPACGARDSTSQNVSAASAANPIGVNQRTFIQNQ